MRAVGRDEVDQRFRVLNGVPEIVPAHVGFQLGIAVLAENLVAHQVERRDPGVASPGDVQRRKVERQAQQVVAQCAGDELVDLVADLVHRAEHDVGRRIRIVGEGERVGEGLDQAHLGHHRLTGEWVDQWLTRRRIDLVQVDVLVQHRVAEAIDDVGELRHDRRVEVDVEAAEDVHGRIDLAGELLEYEVLVLRLGAELRRLEQPLAIPLAVLDDAADACEVGPGYDPIGRKRCVAFIELGLDQLLELIDEAVVLGVENGMDRGQPDVLVHPAIARDVVRVQQLIVVEARRRGIPDQRVGVCDKDVAEIVGGRGAVRHVVDEGDADPHGVGGRDRVRQVALDQAGGAVRVLDHHLRQPVGAGDEVAILVRRQQRHVADIGVGQPDAEEMRRVQLQVSPGRHARNQVVGGEQHAVGAGDTVAQQAAGRMQASVRAGHVVAQEHLVRRVRAIGLALVHEGSDGVHGLVHVIRGAKDAVCARQVGGPRQHHEIGMAAGNVERVIGRKRDEHGAAAALGDQVHAVVEELAEEGEPAAERRRKAVIRRDVVDEQALGQPGDRLAAVGGIGRGGQVAAGDVVRSAENAVGAGRGGVLVSGAELGECFRLRCQGGGVVRGLIGNEVADGARLRVDDEAAG